MDEERFSARPLRRTSKSYGVLLLIFGWVLWTLGVAMVMGAFYYLGFTGFLTERPPFWEIFVTFLCMPVGAIVVDYGQRARLAGRRRLAKVTSLPIKDAHFILYLRAFHEDVGRADLERTWLRPEALMPLAHLGTLFFSGRSMEEHLIACVRHLGRVIAVGSPDEPLPPVGAQRLYIPTHAWREPVQDLMSRARLVIIFLDATPGTLWEFVEATRLVNPQRLLLVAPATRVEYENFRTRATALLQIRAEELYRQTGQRWSPPNLPECQFDTESHGSLKGKLTNGLIFYSADWTPTWLTPIAFPLWDVLGATLRGAMRPAIDQLTTYEDELPEAQGPSIKESKRRVTALESIRRTYVLDRKSVV